MKALQKLIAVSLALVVASSLFVSSALAGQFPKMDLQLGHINPRSPSDQYDRFAVLFAEKINAKTGGAVNVEIFGSGQLGGERDAIEGLQMGTIDLHVFSNFAIAAVHAPSFMIELPFNFPDRQTVYDFLSSPIAQEIADKTYDALDIKIIGWGEGGFRNVLNNVRPLVTPDDFKGIKLRVPESPMFVDTFRALGCNPTPISYPETYTAIQQGTVDGLELPIPSVYSGRYYEINKYMSMTGHFYNALACCVSKTLWESMSPELQKLFIEAAVEAGAEQRIFVQENDQKQLAEMIAAGLTVNRDVDTAAMQKAVASIYDKYRDIIGADLFDRAIKMIRKQ